MKKVLVIGIGAGNPDYVTIQAINALNEVDVFFVVDKGADKDDLVRLRKDICERYIRDPAYRWVEVDDPSRDRTPSSYESEVVEWRTKRTAAYQSVIEHELKDDECGAFLVWGDPSLYDGTMTSLQQILAEGEVAFDYEVIPGISSIQALAAQHKIQLNRIGQPVHITTGRRLREGTPNEMGDIVVMLDGENSFRTVDGDVDIYWGAYLGTEDEVLVSGKLREQTEKIEHIRKAKRAEKGWIMDTYLLRRNS